MIGSTRSLRVFAYTLPTDMRKGFDGLYGMVAENARLRGCDADPQLELELLKEQLAVMQREVFGESSERTPRVTNPDDDKPKKPRCGHGPKSRPNLPVEEVTHTLEEDDRICSICGKTLDEMGDQAEESEEITVVGVEYKILEHQQVVGLVRRR